MRTIVDDAATIFSDGDSTAVEGNVAFMTVAKITKAGESDAFFLERNDLGSFPYQLGDQIGDCFTLEWVQMTVAEFESLPQFAGLPLDDD